MSPKILHQVFNEFLLAIVQPVWGNFDIVELRLGWLAFRRIQQQRLVDVPMLRIQQQPQRFPELCLPVILLLHLRKKRLVCLARLELLRHRVFVDKILARQRFIDVIRTIDMRVDAIPQFTDDINDYAAIEPVCPCNRVFGRWLIADFCH